MFKSILEICNNFNGVNEILGSGAPSIVIEEWEEPHALRSDQPDSDYMSSATWQRWRQKVRDTSVVEQKMRAKGEEAE